MCTKIKMVIELVFKAIVTGFILSIMPGPVFFILLETSIKKGIRAAVSFDVGVLLSDCIYIMIAYVFYSEVQSLTEGSKSEWLKLIGGTLFLIYGLINLFRQPSPIEIDDSGKVIKKEKEYWYLMLKGFVLNFANPLVIFYWFSVMTLTEKSTGDTESNVFFFLAILLSTFFTMDVLKIMAAKRLRSLMTERILKGLNQFIGIVFIGFGLYLGVQSLMSMMNQ